MHKKEFWILTNKCGNNLEHENEAEEPFSLHILSRLMPEIVNDIDALCL